MTELDDFRRWALSDRNGMAPYASVLAASIDKFRAERLVGHPVSWVEARRALTPQEKPDVPGMMKMHYDGPNTTVALEPTPQEKTP